MSTPSILVTGGTGLLGGYLIETLCAKGLSVRALHRAIPPRLRLADATLVEWVYGDVLDVISIDDAMDGIKEVYHCAAIVSFHPRRLKEMHRINVDGTANIVNACLRHNIRKLVHVSSVSALGRKRDGQTITEDAKWDEESNGSAYGRTKFMAEMEVQRGIGEGLNALMVNPSIILGVGDWHKGSSAMFRNAFNEFPWYTDGGTGLVDARDVADVMIRLMDSDISGTRFIVSAENWPYRKVFTEMANALGKKPPHLHARPWMGALVWRWEALKSRFTGEEPLLTRETADTARVHVSYDHGRLLAALPGFKFRPLAESITDYCSEYLVKYPSADR
jgi:nucleoside-diphosphate-sugar epimerase